MSKRRMGVLAVLAIAAAGSVSTAKGQVIRNANVVHYERVRLGKVWRWNPWLGWHVHDEHAWVAVADGPRPAVPREARPSKPKSVEPIKAPKNGLTPVAGTIGHPQTDDKESRIIRGQSPDDGRKSEQPLTLPMAPQGRLIVYNEACVRRYISINGEGYWVAPGRSGEFWVPHAVVEVYLPYWEQPKLMGMSNWRWNGRCHQMGIRIYR